MRETYPSRLVQEPVEVGALANRVEVGVFPEHFLVLGLLEIAGLPECQEQGDGPGGSTFLGLASP